MRDVHMAKKKDKDKKSKRKTNEEEKTAGKARRERKREREKNLHLSKIYGNRTVGFRRSKRQSLSKRRKLRMVTKILEFHQTPRGREFPTWVIFSLKVI